MRVFWTNEELEYLHANYADNFTEDVAKALNKSVKSVYAKAYSLDIRKSKVHHEKVMEKTSIRRREGGKLHRYAKGNVPFNKGKKMPAEVYAKVARTMFGKGHKPHNYRPVGSERITKDGYLERKISDPKTWRAVHVLVWEEVNGPVPKDYKVIFKDKNQLNVELSNLECISSVELMRRNTIIRYPADLRFAMKTLNKLKKQIKNGKEQN